VCAAFARIRAHINDFFLPEDRDSFEGVQRVLASFYPKLASNSNGGLTVGEPFATPGVALRMRPVEPQFAFPISDRLMVTFVGR